MRHTVRRGVAAHGGGRNAGGLRGRAERRRRDRRHRDRAGGDGHHGQDRRRAHQDQRQRLLHQGRRTRREGQVRAGQRRRRRARAHDRVPRRGGRRPGRGQGRRRRQETRAEGPGVRAGAGARAELRRGRLPGAGGRAVVRLGDRAAVVRHEDRLRLQRLPGPQAGRGLADVVGQADGRPARRLRRQERVRTDLRLQRQQVRRDHDLAVVHSGRVQARRAQLRTPRRRAAARLAPVREQDHDLGRRRRRPTSWCR